MKLISFLLILFILFYGLRSKGSLLERRKITNLDNLILVKKIPVYVKVPHGESVLKKPLIDSLKALGFKLVDSVNARKLFGEGLNVIMPPDPRNPEAYQEYIDKMKDKNYALELLEKSTPVSQDITFPSIVDSGFIPITRTNPHRMASRIFKVPFTDDESLTVITSRIIDSLTGRR